jgi:DNA segregation ATPase FtsK/SpoIIIE, S-DNA-T family
MFKCEQCGFDYAELVVSEAPEQFRERVSAIVDRLSRHAPDVLRIRPSPTVWSALEYGCHVRDVLLVQRDRALLALVEDNPQFPPMYREERVANARYDSQGPAELGEELKVAVNMLAKLAGELTEKELSRPCVYNFPEPTQRDVGWLFRHTMHEVVHHLMDVTDVLRAVSSRTGT